MSPAKPAAYSSLRSAMAPPDLGIRLYTSFVPCFYHFLNSPEITPPSRYNAPLMPNTPASAVVLLRIKANSTSPPTVAYGILLPAHMGICSRVQGGRRLGTRSDVGLEGRCECILPDGRTRRAGLRYHLVCRSVFAILDLASATASASAIPTKRTPKRWSS
jgi:hypothetical protein